MARIPAYFSPEGSTQTYFITLTGVHPELSLRLYKHRTIRKETANKTLCALLAASFEIIRRIVLRQHDNFLHIALRENFAQDGFDAFCGNVVHSLLVFGVIVHSEICGEFESIEPI